jgi:fumarylacetoacetase
VSEADASLFGLENLPYGVFSAPGRAPHVGVRFEDSVVDLAPLGDVFREPSLNAFMTQGPAAWSEARGRARELIQRGTAELLPLADVELHLPFEPADYVDFYSSLEHATNLGRMFRPDAEPLLANWKHLPVGYHGRAGTLVVSGTPIVRPNGQVLPPGADAPAFGPSRRLDIELELGFVVGVPSTLGQPVPASAFAERVFGVVLVNDWSARDIQAWEYQPLGPFLGKSFATSISAWVVPLAALEPFRVRGPAQEPPPLPYLTTGEPWNLDLELEIELNRQRVSRTNASGLYWSMAQQLAHATCNGASIRTGDLFASGTISGSEPDSRGSLIELTWNGREPLRLADGSHRTFLEDGDEVVLRGRASRDSARIGLGEVRGRILQAR